MLHFNTIRIELIILVIIALIFLLLAYVSGKNEKYKGNFYIKSGIVLAFIFALVGIDCLLNLIDTLTS